jgi:biofilm PGA synthesis N-glycosyltransferase PgaC
VIPAFNSADTIRYTLSSVLSNDFPRSKYEVIAVDNGSTDRTVDICRKFPVEVVSCPKKGQGAALNRGIKKARGNIICITNSDVVVSKDWLKKISEYFENNPGVDGVGGPVLSPLHKHKNNVQKFTGELYVEDQMFPEKVTVAQYMKMYSGGLLGSANCAYKKSALVSIGGFDESLLFTEVDICWRLIKAGKHLIFDPQIKVVHMGFPSSLQEVFKQQFKWGKGSTELMKKYRSGNVKNDLKWEISSLYYLIKVIKAFLLLPICSPKEKQLLRCFHYISYFLGRIYGFS